MFIQNVFTGVRIGEFSLPYAEFPNSITFTQDKLVAAWSNIIGVFSLTGQNLAEYSIEICGAEGTLFPLIPDLFQPTLSE